MLGRAALVALIASATADRPQVVVTRSSEASPAPPVLPTAGRAHVVAYSGSTAAQRHTNAKRPLLKSRRNDQKLALRHVLDTSRAVREAARAVNKAKRKLAEARRRSSEAREQLVKLEQLKAAAAGGGKARQEAQAAQERALLLARCRTCLLLFGFTFMNGLARRSLSSSAPSLVAEGIVSHPRVEDIFMIGFEVFCVGKLLAVPVLLLLKPRLGLLLQIVLMGAACAWYLIAPQQALLPAWVLFRIFSAMAVSTMLPFVGQWFPRPYYGRIFALLFSGFQVGYLACSYGWGYLLSKNRLHWRVPMEHCVAGFAVLFVGCALWLEETPPPPPALPGATEGKARLDELQRLEASGAEKKQSRLERRRTSKQQLYALCHKLATRWVFWAMLIYCASYSPAVEYSTHVTSYLKEMTSPGFVATKGSPEAGFVCLQTARCEGRYRTYVGAYLSTLLLGSLLYDRASQLDRAFLVGGLLLLNTFCWAALALAEPDAPAPAWVKAVIQTSVSYVNPRWRVLAALSRPVSSSAPPLDASVAPRLSLSTATKTALAALAGASIALPASLPFAIFSLDFGKEGAAVLASILQVVGSLSALAFLKSFPDILRSRGWFGVHALLALMGLLASLSVGTVMFADFQKFSRGYVVRSSLLNESVVTLHACSRPECAMYPMWRPGQRRAWGPMAGSHLLPYAPSAMCHRCGRGDRLVSCKVDEAARTAALLTPYDECAEWIRTEKPLQKPKEGWEFANDPTKFALWDDDLGDQDFG